MRHVVVAGSGVAGTAAALTAARGGAEVTLVAAGPGASVLAGGALDLAPWEDEAATRDAAPMPESASYVLDRLAAFAVGERPALVAATTGLVRPARGVNRALLDLASLPDSTEPRVVLVPSAGHGAWDAASLARAWSASPRARAAGLTFVDVAVTLLARTEEHSFPDRDLAARHDDPARLAWLGDRLREALVTWGRPFAAMVLPPWLGVVQERAAALSAYVGCPCGEALAGVSGASGLRFEHARDRALSTAGVRVIEGRATRIEAAPEGSGDRAWRVHVAVRGGLPDETTLLECDAAVLATGGLLGGGLEYTPAWAFAASALPTEPRPLLRATCEAPVRLGAFGHPLDDPSSLFGGAPETHAWPFAETPLLDHAGILVDDGGEVRGAAPGLFATGEVAAGPAHAWLAALAHGAGVGERAGG